MRLLLVTLAPGSLNHIANIVKGYAIAIGIAFAMWIVWRWWQARQRELSADRAARARGVWARHLGVALQHPELAEPMLGSLSSPAEITRYRIFVDGILAAAGEILALEPSAAWRAALLRHLGPHASYLSSAEFQSGRLADCPPEVQALIRELSARPGG